MKLPIKMLLVLAVNRELTYKEIQKKTGFHVNTVSRQISLLDKKGILAIKQKKSGSLRGKKWVNVVSLKKEFFTEGIAGFFEKIAAKLNIPLDDLFID